MNLLLHPTIDGDMAGESGGEFHTLRKLPNPAVCRGEIVGARLVECLVEGPEDCPHALAYGCGFFCLHPQRKRIAAHTEGKGGGIPPSVISH